MSDIFGAIGNALTAVFEPLWDSATLSRDQLVLTRPQSPVKGTPLTFTCKAQIDDGSSYSRAGGGVVERRRTVLILRQTLATVPEPQDSLEITFKDGTSETLVLGSIDERDPVNSYYRVEIVK